jgi:hypothetical protein
MSYKYSKGNQIIGDLSGSDDSNRDTGIDFEENYISLRANNNDVLVVSGSNVGIGTTTPDSTLHIAGNLHISGSDQEGLRIAKGDDDYRQLVFENEGVDAASFTLSNAENLVIMNEVAGKDIQLWVDSAAGADIQAVTIKESGKVGVISTDPIAELDVAGKIAITAEVSTPSQPADGNGLLYTKSDGKLYWRSHDVSETDLTATGGGGGISFDGSTANGILTYKDSDEATVESSLTYDGTELFVSGNVKFEGVKTTLPVNLDSDIAHDASRNFCKEFFWRFDGIGSGGGNGWNSILQFRPFNEGTTDVLTSAIWGAVRWEVHYWGHNNGTGNFSYHGVGYLDYQGGSLQSASPATENILGSNPGFQIAVSNSTATFQVRGGTHASGVDGGLVIKIWATTLADTNGDNLVWDILPLI